MKKMRQTEKKSIRSKASAPAPVRMPEPARVDPPVQSRARAQATAPRETAAARRAREIEAARALAQQTFLDSLSKGLSPTAAANLAKISRQTAYTWRSQDADFDAKWNEAIEAGTDLLEDVAHKRATIGVLRPVFQQGKQVGAVTEYSDQLLLAALAKRRADWRQSKHRIELTGAGGGPVQIEAVRSRIAGKLAAITGETPLALPAPERRKE